MSFCRKDKGGEDNVGNGNFGAGDFLININNLIWYLNEKGQLQ